MVVVCAGARHRPLSADARGAHVCVELWYLTFSSSSRDFYTALLRASSGLSSPLPCGITTPRRGVPTNRWMWLFGHQPLDSVLAETTRHRNLCVRRFSSGKRNGQADCIVTVRHAAPYRLRCTPVSVSPVRGGCLGLHLPRRTASVLTLYGCRHDRGCRRDAICSRGRPRCTDCCPWPTIRRRCTGARDRGPRSRPCPRPSARCLPPPGSLRCVPRGLTSG